MLTKHIQSLQHSLIKDFIKLRKDRKYRCEKKRVLIMGEKMVFELSHLSYEYLICKDPKEVSSLKARTLIVTNDNVFQKITGLRQVEPYAAVVQMPSLSFEDKNYVLILDQICDPGNLGTLFRSALALGFSGVILTKNSVDPFNDKALRSAKGATFHLPFLFMAKEEISSFLPLSTFFLADLDGDDLKSLSFSPPLALILSHESLGASSWEQVKKIKIPMKNKVDSLNVATSGSILMYMMKHL